MRILIWHVHGSWTTSFVQGPHNYVLPVTPGRGADGRGRADTWKWPPSAREVSPAQLADEPLDCVVLQRPEEVSLCEQWTGRRPGVDLPALYLEHNAPTGHAVATPHPVITDRRLHGIPLVHVTHFNAMAWDSGAVTTSVVEHGIPDPGPRYTGEDPSLAVVVNEPVRRWRVAGTDLLLEMTREVPTHVYGMGMAALGERALADGVTGLVDRLHDDVPQSRMHSLLGTHRAYFHPYRWTSLGLSLIEAMTLGMPVLALATTEAPVAVPTAAGLLSCDFRALRETAIRWMTDPREARDRGAAAREHALSRYGLQRFLDDWDELLKEVVR